MTRAREGSSSSGLKLVFEYPEITYGHQCADLVSMLAKPPLLDEAYLFENSGRGLIPVKHLRSQPNHQ